MTDPNLQNFWYWLIVNLVEFTIRRFLPYFPRHEHWGLPALVLLYGGEIATILFVFLGSFLDLWNLIRILLIVSALEIWRHKGKILKAVTFLRFLA